MADKRTLGQGNIDVVLIDEHGQGIPRILKPSIHAMRTLSRKYGGLQKLASRVGELEFEAIVDVLEVGLQVPAGSPKARQEIEALVYSTGFTELPGLCIRYIAVLLNGGKPPPDVPDQQPDGPLAPAGS
jgi:hypothetical protein